MNNQKYAKYADNCICTSNGWIKTNPPTKRKVKIDFMPALVTLAAMLTIVYILSLVIGG